MPSCFWLFCELAADTESDVEPDSDVDWKPDEDDSSDSDAELSTASANQYRGGVFARKSQKKQKRTGTCNSDLSNLSSCMQNIIVQLYDPICITDFLSDNR